MSGIYGVCGAKAASDSLHRMRSALPAHGEVNAHQWLRSDGCGGFGAVHPARVREPGHFAEDADADVACVVDGVIYRDSATVVVEPQSAHRLLHAYLKTGVRCLSDFTGSFTVAWWDGNAQRLTLATDKVGQRLLYYGMSHGRLAFGSTLAHVLASDVVPAELDAEAIADLLAYGYVLGERTLFRDVFTLPPAGVLTFDRRGVEVRQYWRLDHVEPHGRYDRSRLDEFQHLFTRAVRRSVRQDITTAVDLTGGLDSRCIFAAAVADELRFPAHTGGQSDSTDVVLARRLARMANVPHVFEYIGPERLADWLHPMVLYQGGMVATLHCHPCQHFDDDLEFDAVVQGIGATYVRGHWVTAQNLHLDTAQAALNYLQKRISTPTVSDLDAEQLWQPGFREVGRHAAQGHLRDLLFQFEVPDQPVSVMDYLALRERCRKFLNKAIMIVRGRREAYFPYLDHELLEALAALPVRERVTNSILTDLTRRYSPALLKVPYEKTMIPLSASPTRKRMIRIARAIRRRAARRLSFVGPVPEKVPNHYYAQWIRGDLRAKLTEILYNPDAAFRAYLRWDVVEQALGEHFSGRRNWEPLIGALTVIELAHQTWVAPTEHSKARASSGTP